MQIVKIYLSVFVLMLLSGSCKKSTSIQIDYKYAYFPLHIGHTVIYDVDSILYNPLYTNGRDTVHWQLKEVVESQFVDLTGREAYRINRYQREDSTKNWKTGLVWYAVRNQTNVESVEDNLRFIRLIFPPKLGDTWMGNTYLPTGDTLPFYKNWVYTYQDIDVPADINHLHFDSTLTIIEVDDENLLERRWSTATYAKNAGLIYREVYNLSFVGSSIPIGSVPWEEKANRGYILRMKINFVK